MARNIANAKRSNKPNPREERNTPEYRRKRDNIVNFDEAASKSYRRKKVELLPRNLAQENYLDALEDTENDIIFAMGPAGCGKTLFAALYAVQCLQEGSVEKIIITRPAVSVDEQHGFLPGSLIEKLAPWVIPLTDVFKEYYSPQQVEKMLAEEIIEIAPLAYMRGRTLKNAIIIADEMQNSTISQLKMVLTRLGEGSRMIITGDLAQHDRGYEINGLKDFTDRLVVKGSKHLKVINFSSKDVERHRVVEEILNIYGDN